MQSPVSATKKNERSRKGRVTAKHDIELVQLRGARKIPTSMKAFVDLRRWNS
ncbi:unnamed protein product, partial [Chrysoparadoxa australica]